MQKYIIYSISFFMLLACNESIEKETTVIKEEKVVDENPAAEGFNYQGSDPQAIAIADEVMKAMGGRKAWDTTRHIQWNFFGVRTLIWDKLDQKVKIDYPRKEEYYEYDIAQDQVQVFVKGKEVTDKDALLAYKVRARGIWINDSYWLVMPFKLKDSGVTLKYIGEEVKLFEGTRKSKVHVLQLTFEQVGFTPENKYYVYVDQQDNLIKAWRYFENFDDKEGEYVTWSNYKKYGDLLLSNYRGDDSLSQISVAQKETALKY